MGGSSTLLIDVSGESIVAAVVEADGLRFVEFDGERSLPAAVGWDTQRGSLLVGADALSTQPSDRAVEARVGARLDQEVLHVGDRHIPVSEALAALLRAVASRAPGTRADRPAAVWIAGRAPVSGDAARDRLLAAVRAAGLGEASFVPRPTAIAASVPEDDVGPGERLVVAEVEAASIEVTVLARRPTALEPVGVTFTHALDPGAALATSEELARAVVQAAAEAGGIHTVVFAGVADALTGASEAIARFGITPEPGDPATVALRGLFALARASFLEGASDDSADGGDAVVTGGASPSTFEPTPPGDEAADAGRLDEDVQFTVYRPQSICPERWYTALVFAHKSVRIVDELLGVCEPIAEVRKQAEARLGPALGSFGRTTQDSVYDLARGSEITFVPRGEGLRFNPPSASFLWEEPVHVEEFRLVADAAMLGKRIRGAVSVFSGALLLAEVSLTVSVGDQDAPPAPERASPYRKIFFSYSHLDTAVVEQVELLYASLGDEVLRDKRVLRSGEVWDERVQEMIREAEIFQLFWSTNSMTSEWVTKEWRYALDLQRRHFVRPTYWQEPMPSVPAEDLPPQELLRLHFSKLPGASRAPTVPPNGPTVPSPLPSTRSVPALGEPPPPVPPPAGSGAGPASEGGEPLPPASMAQAREQGGAAARRRRRGSSASGMATRAHDHPEPRSRRSSALVGGGALTAALVALLVGGFAVKSGGSSAPRPAAPVTSAAPAPTGTQGAGGAAPPEHEGGGGRTGAGSSCAGCRAVPRTCPTCVARSGSGSTQIGPVTSGAELLTWSAPPGQPFRILLDGSAAADSSAGSGRLTLPGGDYSEVLIETEGPWSVVIH